MKSFVLAVALLATPMAAYAGDGGIDNTGALLIKALGHLVGKLMGAF